MLKIAFSGQHNNQMNGFYRSEYTDVHGNKKTMVSTQFESIDARKCLPCWDEPERKATFKCWRCVPVHMTALSNMPESRLMSHGDGTKTVSFLESPRMSTYLLAFVVGEFDHVSSLTQHGVLIRVFGPPGKPELGEFALDCAVKALDVYDDTFGQPFPLPKQDMVAIPEFAMGAMENWGLVTYREVDLLIDGGVSRQRQRVAEVVIPSSRTSGSEISSRWPGGTTSGSTRVSRRGSRPRSPTTSTRSGRCGSSSSSTCRGARSSWTRCGRRTRSRCRSATPRRSSRSSTRSRTARVARSFG